jgi:MFS superfamily sulfate permease-like transporter
MFQDIKNDLPAGIVVTFVAIPLCLGIALASGAPLFSGLIAGIIGGIVVGIFSGSPLGVSGPAAGLAVVVLNTIETVGSYEAALLCFVLVGVMQLVLGFARAGFIAFFFPSSVIKGMLTGIGILIILKQLPYALGLDKHSHLISKHFFTEVFTSKIDVVLVTIVSLAILILWDTVLSKNKVFRIIPGPLVAILAGMALSYSYQKGMLNFTLTPEQLVSLPVTHGIEDFFSKFTFPDFSGLHNYVVWEMAVVMTIVATLETLLCVEATDKLDPLRRITPTNRELKAQGLGNIISGLLGGLPITQVIVRSSANITFGGKTKLSTILHGCFLLIGTITIPQYLNMVPLATLASILFVVGFKLAKPSLFKNMYRFGQEQFIPFIATVGAIAITGDLLEGIKIGIMTGIFYTLKHSYRNAYHMKDIIEAEDGTTVHHIVLAEEVSFFNKGSFVKALSAIPNKSKVVIDCTNSKSISFDVVEIIKDFEISAKDKNIVVEKIKFIEPAHYVPLGH